MSIALIQKTFVWYPCLTDRSGKTKSWANYYRGLERCLAGKWVFWLVVTITNKTGKWITGALSCPFKIGLSSQTMWVDLPVFPLCGWFTAHEIPSTRTTFSWLMAAKLALQLRQECPEVGRPPFRWSRDFGDDGPQLLLTKVHYLPWMPRESAGRKRDPLQ